MIRAEDGSLLIAGYSISNHLQESELLGYVLPLREPLRTGNYDYRVYRIEGEIGGRRSGAILTFKKGMLEVVSLAISLREDEAWNTWKPEDEVRRKALHEKLLQEWLGSGSYQFSWGSVHSLVDSRSGAAEIVIKYSA